MSIRFHEQVQRAVCPYCLAAAGDPCRTRRGRRLPHGHEHLVRLKRAVRRGIAPVTTLDPADPGGVVRVRPAGILTV